ncbi:MAG: methyltransferase regulatory domain-containing protein, partial [Myxococcota bacterium]
ADALADANPSYVFHEHLEHYNDPVYFHEFVSRAQTMGLRYLGDADLPSMHVGNCPPKAAAKLREIDDIVRQEQYIDFLTNRRFRSTLLCRETQLPDRTLSPEALCSLCYATSVRPRSGWASPPRSGQPLVLDDPRTGRTFTIRDRVIAAFIEALATPVASRLKPLTLTLKQLAREIDLDADGRLAIVSRLGEMIFTGLIQVASTPSTAPPKLSPRPKSWACSRIYAEHRDVIPNLEHRNVHVPPQWRLLLTILDGSLTADEAVHRFAADSGEHGSPRRRQEEAWETLHALLTLSLLES